MYKSLRFIEVQNLKNSNVAQCTKGSDSRSYGIKINIVRLNRKFVCDFSRFLIRPCLMWPYRFRSYGQKLNSSVKLLRFGLFFVPPVPTDKNDIIIAYGCNE